MAGIVDLLGTLLQQGMTQSGNARMSNSLGGDSSLGDLLGNLSKMTSGETEGGQSGGGLLGSLIGSLTGRSSNTGESAQTGAAGGLVGSILESLGDNKAAAGGVGALIGSLLGGGSDSAKGAIGGGGLAVLASLAFSALKKAGEAPTEESITLKELQKPIEEQDLEENAKIIVRAMINAAKADGDIDQSEIDKIIGKLDDDGLDKNEKEFFLTESRKPSDMNAVIASANNQPEMAAQIYAASLLAIEMDTPEEEKYMQSLASGLELNPQVVAYIESSMGVHKA